MAFKYFFFSNKQLSFFRDQEAKMGKVFKPGQVIVKGSTKPFTEMTSNDTLSRFPDAKLVISGETDDLKFTIPSAK